MRFLKKNKNPVLTSDYFKNKVSKKVFSDWQSKGGEIGRFSYGGLNVYGLREALSNDIHFKIGSFCSFAKGIELYLCYDHNVKSISTYPFNVFKEDWPLTSQSNNHPVSKGNIEIGSDVWIGNDVKILSGVKIGHGAVIGLGSVVTKNVGAYEIWAGVPARKIRDRFSEEEKNLLLEAEWWNLNTEYIKTLAPLLLDSQIMDFVEKVKEIKRAINIA